MSGTDRPLYARVLRLRQLDPSGLRCFLLFEGAVILGVLLALAELVSWWGVLVLPASIAVMVKLNDLIAVALVDAGQAAPPTGEVGSAPMGRTDRVSATAARPHQLSRH